MCIMCIDMFVSMCGERERETEERERKRESFRAGSPGKSLFVYTTFHRYRYYLSSHYNVLVK